VLINHEIMEKTQDLEKTIIKKNLHDEFVRLGRERNQITYKLLALLPEINRLRVYAQKGYGNIYEYAARIAGLSPKVVSKALRIQEKLKDLPHLKEKVETQGINKVGIVVGLATKENEKDLAEKVENMSKPALQEYSKEVRGKITVSWQVELDDEMMFMLLKLKKKLGENLSNKECLRRILLEMDKGFGREGDKMKSARTSTQKNDESQSQEKKRLEPDAIARQQPKLQTKETTKIPGEKVLNRFSRYISVYRKREVGERCSYAGCPRPADVIHHPDRFSEHHSHEKLKPLCKQHHEFAHNGVSEVMRSVDYKYRKQRQVALL